MKLYIIAITLLFAGSANASIFFDDLSVAKKYVAKQKDISLKTQKSYKMVIPPIPEYDEYNIVAIDDPFTVRPFVVIEDENANPEPLQKIKCEFACGIPPAPHAKSFLEKYSLSELSFVGVLSADINKALIKTPDLGVVTISIGDYIGNKNGMVKQIDKRAMVVEEKSLQGSVWRDKKTILTIK